MEGEQQESTQRHLERVFHIGEICQSLKSFLFLVKQKFLELLSWEKNLSGVKSNPVSPMASSHNVSLHSGWGLSIYYVKCVKREKEYKR